MRYTYVVKTYKVRIYPTTAQEGILNKMLEQCRWVFNKVLETRKNSFEQDGVSLNNYDTMVMLPIWKRARASLKLVHSQVMQNVNVRVDLAFKAFFRRVKAGEEKAGYPRFKGYGRYDSMTYPQYGNGVKLVGNQLHLSKLGSVKVKLHRELCGIPKTVCIRRGSTGKWFATFSCECEATLLPEGVKAVGVDVGLQHFATLSDGKKIANPRFFRKEEKALAKAQRRMSVEAKGTPERAKRRKVVGRVCERIANRRTDFAHQTSRRLVNEFNLIAFEDLDVKQMMSNKTEVFGNKLNQSIADVAWNQLVQFTTYKAEDAGRKVILVDPRNTSKKCSRCSVLVQKDLSVRVHHCPTCGLSLDRDHNAAINILALGLQRMGSGIAVKSLEAQCL